MSIRKLQTAYRVYVTVVIDGCTSNLALWQKAYSEDQAYFILERKLLAQGFDRVELRREAQCLVASA